MTIAAPLPSSVEIAEDSETIDDHFFLPWGQNGSGKSPKIAYGCGILRILVRETETGFEKTPNFRILYR